MNARVSFFVVAAALLCSTGAPAACLPGQTGACAKIDLNGVTDITQRIVAQETIAPAPKKAAPSDPTQPYTGPTFGVSNQVRRAPIVGYRWATD